LLQELHNADNRINADPNFAPGLAQAAAPDPLVHNAPPPDEAVPVGEYLRRLAIRLLDYPDSQTDMIHMEPGAPGRVRVSISFETATGNVLFPN
jgi:hypothetical protein